MKYHIWSNEHHSWWRANANGYTPNLDEAGVYDRTTAIAICRKATYGWHDRSKPPNEIPVLVDDAWEALNGDH